MPPSGQNDTGDGLIMGSNISERRKMRLKLSFLDYSSCFVLCTSDIYVSSVRPRKKDPPLWFFLRFLILGFSSVSSPGSKVKGQRRSHLYSLSKLSEIMWKLWFWAVQINVIGFENLPTRELRVVSSAKWSKYMFISQTWHNVTANMTLAETWRTSLSLQHIVWTVGQV